MITVVKIETFHLEMPGKPRRYVFKIEGDKATVERYTGGRLERRDRGMTIEKARKLYAWLLKIGYEKW